MNEPSDENSDPMPDDWIDYGSPDLSLIRWLGFVGNTHYCPQCLNEFWAAHGLHEPDCAWAENTRREAEEAEA